MCNEKSFVHLHTHGSVGSIRDATCQFDTEGKGNDNGTRCPLNKASELGMESYALTDHGSLSAVPMFVAAAQRNGVKPIIGCEFYLTASKKDRQPYYHLILLAKNIRGYRKLLRATTTAHMEGFYRRPRIDWDDLVDMAPDVVCTTACVGGPLIRPFLDSNYSEVEEGMENTKRLIHHFGPDDLYIELQNHRHSPEEIPETDMFDITNEYAMGVAKDLGLKTVLTNDIHYVDSRDAEIHKALLAAAQGKTIYTLDYVYRGDFSVRSAEEMRALAPNDECCDTTLEINDKIDWIDLNLKAAWLPTVDDLTPEQANERLKKIAIEKIKAIGKHQDPVYAHRLAEELRFLMDNNLGQYFLPLIDVIDHAANSCIPLGAGRGSAGGSLVANLTRITKLDPIEHGMMFGRFLNPGRIKKYKAWEVELEDGTVTDIIENYPYHVKEDGKWAVKMGQEIVAGAQCA